MQSWPICGGKNLAPPPRQQELLLTGYLHTHTNPHTEKRSQAASTLQVDSTFIFYDTNLAHICCFLVTKMTKSSMETFLSYPMWNTWIFGRKAELLVTCPKTLEPDFVNIVVAVRKTSNSWQSFAIQMFGRASTGIKHNEKQSFTGWKTAGMVNFGETPQFKNLYKHTI